jgi:hypothetical protein
LRQLAATVKRRRSRSPGVYSVFLSWQPHAVIKGTVKDEMFLKPLHPPHSRVLWIRVTEAAWPTDTRVAGETPKGSCFINHSPALEVASTNTLGDYEKPPLMRINPTRPDRAWFGANFVVTKPCAE